MKEVRNLTYYNKQTKTNKTKQLIQCVSTGSLQSLLRRSIDILETHFISSPTLCVFTARNTRLPRLRKIKRIRFL